MASKFFADANDSDHSDNEDKKSVDSVKDKPVQKKQAYFDSSSDDDTGRVVRSEKDKRLEVLQGVINKIKEKMSIKDFISLETEFDNLHKEYEKSKKVVDKEKQEAEAKKKALAAGDANKKATEKDKKSVHLSFIRICYALEQFVNNVSAEEKKALKSANNKAFNILKQRLKKNSKAFEADIKDFEQNPVYSDENVSSSGEESADEKKKKVVKQDEEEDDDYWDKPAQDDDESDDDDPDDIKKYLLSNDPQVRRNYWLKRDNGDDKEKKGDGPRRIGAQKVKDYAKLFDDDKKPKITYKFDEMDTKIKELVDRRSGRKTNSKDKKLTIDDDLEILKNFYALSTTDVEKLEVILHLLPTRQESSRQISQYCMPRPYYLENFLNLQEYFKIIKKNYKGLASVRSFQRDGDNYYKESQIYETFGTHFEGLDSELQKSFRMMENGSPEYSERLRDYAALIKLCTDAYLFFSNCDDEQLALKFAYKRVENTYFLSDRLYQKLIASANERGISTENEFYADNSVQTSVTTLAKRLYAKSDTKTITRTILYHVYNHAINGRYQEAKDLILMSHIVDYSQSLEPNLQVLYNRVLVQMGVCAFSSGLIQETINCLSEIVSSQRLKELIGQGLSKNTFNEKDERRRLVPVHMHINTDLVEAVYNIAAMLIEVPSIVAEQYDATKKQANRQFRKVFEGYKNIYGPPETAKDHVMAAGKALQQGNWKQCYDLLLNLNVWNKLSQDTAAAQSHLLDKVKEQAFKCYIFVYQNNYDSVDIDHLANKFAITKDYIHAFVSKLVFNQELKAYLDTDSNCLMFERDGNTRMESLALNLADRVSNFLANNERIMDSKYGNYGFSDKDIGEKILFKKPKQTKKINIAKDKKKGKGKKN